MQENKFFVDQPVGNVVGRLFQIFGWYLHCTDEACSLEVRIDGEPRFGLLRVYRHDVAAAFADRPLAVKSGFIGDVYLPDTIEPRSEFDLSIAAISAAGEQIIFSRRLTLSAALSPDIRTRRLDIASLLDEPLARAHGAARDTVAQIPHFFPKGGLPIVRLSEAGTTHAYGDLARKIIDDNRGKGYVMDFGAGVQTPARLHPHVINVDAIHFPYVDVVNACATLPFRSGAFSAVVSQAVFEHLPDPSATAAEIHRVLEPGGTVLIDTAFMQPFHGDPSHYFNMTKEGLRQVLRGFEILEIGVQPYQMPSHSLSMQIGSILPFVKPGAWQSKLQRLLSDLAESGAALDTQLGLVGQEVLAAGVYAVARKPG